MIVRAWPMLLALAVALAGGAVSAAAPAMAQEGGRQAAARELAGLMLDDASRRRLEEQVTVGLGQAIGSTLQERLGRGLTETEWNMIGRIVTRFVADTLPRGRAVEIAADAYARQFDEAELRELLAFQHSPVARKVARLAPVIAADSARAIDAEIRRSAAMPRLVDDLLREFPILKPESP